MGINLTELSRILPYEPIQVITFLESVVGFDEDAFLENEDFRYGITAERMAGREDEFAGAVDAFEEVAEDKCDWASQSLREQTLRFCSGLSAGLIHQVAQIQSAAMPAGSVDDVSTRGRVIFSAIDLHDFLVRFLAEVTDSKVSWIEAMLESSPQPSAADLASARASGVVDWNDPVFADMQVVARAAQGLKFEKDKLDVSFHSLPRAGITAVFATTITQQFGMEGFHLTHSAFSFLKASKVGEDNLEVCETIAGSENPSIGDVDAFCMSAPLDYVVDQVAPRRGVLRIHTVSTDDPDTSMYLCKLLPSTAYSDLMRARGVQNVKSMGEIYVLWRAERIRLENGSPALKLCMGLFLKADPLEEKISERSHNKSGLVDWGIRQFYSMFMMPKLYDTYADGVARFVRAKKRLAAM